jgi:hypothetical protein
MPGLCRPRLLLVIFLAVSTGFAHQRGFENTQSEQSSEGKYVLWVDPGDIKSLDFRYGIGGPGNQPLPPFRFIEEDRSGTTPKIHVRDARDIAWNVKWGPEASPSAFCTRLMWACGYFVQPEYFLKSGHIEGARDLKRAKSHISDDGSFVNARFQLRTDSPEYLEGYRWTWTNNPFVRTHQIQGLKILSQLVSNWDTKESNLGLFLDDRTGTPRYYYSILDWGASLGKWGNPLTWTRNDCNGFANQTPSFVKRAKDGSLQWGFHGKNRESMTSDITVNDVRWLLRYLGEISDDQIRTGLIASGNSPEDANCYSQALRNRIQQLQQLVR